jgi:hypothetical protein
VAQNQQQLQQQAHLQNCLSATGIDPRAMKLAEEVLRERPSPQGCISQEEMLRMAHRIDQAMRGVVDPPPMVFMPSFL